MAKSIIVYGRDLKQMVKYAGRIAKHLGMSHVEVWGAQKFPRKLRAQNALVLFEWRLDQPPQIKNGHKAFSFAGVARQINSSIAMTEFEEFPPPSKGVWDSPVYGYFYFDGKVCGNGDKTPDLAIRQWKMWGDNAEQRKSWRGLSEEPILVTA